MRLEAWMGEHLMGWLNHDPQSNRFAFEYAPVWLGRESAFPLSPCLPLSRPANLSADTHSATVRQFFENLLPEGDALDDASVAFQVTKANLIGLLSALGRETAGALSLRTEGASINEAMASRRHLPRSELSERIRDRHQVPFSVWDGKIRLSIAGYQDKVAVLEDADSWYLVEGRDLASTHILKPEPAHAIFAGLTTNEFFCMRLARAVKLPVAEVRLHHVPEPVLAIKRFDRIVTGSTVRRLPAIDGCQALGLSVGFKYERPYGDSPDVRNIRDGASLPMFFKLMAAAARPIVERRALLRWAIFQVLIGNTDAHAKNLTFLVNEGGLTLAAAYDLVCCLVFDGQQVADTYAMAIGDAFAPADVSAMEWASFCLAADLPPAMVRNELQTLVRDTLTSLPIIADAARQEGADDGMLGKALPAIESECHRQLEMAKHIPEMFRHEKRALNGASKKSADS